MIELLGEYILAVLSFLLRSWMLSQLMCGSGWAYLLTQVELAQQPAPRLREVKHEAQLPASFQEFRMPRQQQRTAPRTRQSIR
jgi:hypothetical protein